MQLLFEVQPREEPRSSQLHRLARYDRLAPNGFWGNESPFRFTFSESIGKRTGREIPVFLEFRRGLATHHSQVRNSLERTPAKLRIQDLRSRARTVLARAGMRELPCRTSAAVCARHQASGYEDELWRTRSVDDVRAERQSLQRLGWRSAKGSAPDAAVSERRRPLTLGKR